MLTTSAAQLGAPAKRLDVTFAAKANVGERLPMLAVTLQRAGEICAEALQEVSANVPLISLKGIENGSAETLAGSVDNGIVAGIVHATKWDARLLVTLRQDAVLTLLKIMFGGDGSEPADLGTRPLSKIEVGLARSFFARLALALEQAFADLAETPFVVELAEQEGSTGHPSTVAKWRWRSPSIRSTGAGAAARSHSPCRSPHSPRCARCWRRCLRKKSSGRPIRIGCNASSRKSPAPRWC